MSRQYHVLVAILSMGAGLREQEVRPGSAPTPVLVLNVNSRGEVRVPTRKEPLRTEKEVEAYLKAEFQRVRPDPTKDANKELRTAILASAHTRYRDLHRLMEQCRAAGFGSLRLSVLRE